MILCFEPIADRARELKAVLDGDLTAAESLAQLEQMVAADRSVQLVLFGPGVLLEDALRFTRHMRVSRPWLGVVLLREQLEMVVLAEAIRAGVREVVAAHDVDGARGACIRSLEVSRQLAAAAPAVPTTQPPVASGKLVTVFAGKGGCGKSTMATNLAVAIAAGGARRVLLIDLDLSFGDVAIMLQLVPERSMADAVPMAGRLDETGLRSLLVPFGPGVDTLLAPAGPADGERVSRELVAELIEVARRVYDYVIVDTPPFFSDQVLAALDVSDWYVLLATPDIASLKNLRLTLDMFDLLEYPADRRVVLLNRADARVGLTPTDIQRVVRAPIVGHVPSTRDVPTSVNRGVPLALEDPNHAVSRAIRDIAAKHLGAGPIRAPAEKSGKRRPFGAQRGK
jgi:pilus assembly protein CpaE